MTPFSFKQSVIANQIDVGSKGNSKNSISPKNEGLLNNQSYSDIMKQRWLKANKAIPLVDQNDILEEHPFFNGGKVVKSSFKH